MQFHCSVRSKAHFKTIIIEVIKYNFASRVPATSIFPLVFNVGHSCHFPSYPSFWENKFATSVLASFLLCFCKLLFLLNSPSAAQRPKNQQTYFKLIPDTQATIKTVSKEIKYAWRKQHLKSSPEVVALMLEQIFLFFFS